MRDTYHVHIVGCRPRSGTTLLAEAMRTCFRTNDYPAHEWSLSESKWGGPGIRLTKKPIDIVVSSEFLEAIDDLTVIYLLRDPRDVVVSNHAADPEKYWVGMNFWRIYSQFAARKDDHPRLVVLRYEQFVSDPDDAQDRILRRLGACRQ